MRKNENMEAGLIIGLLILTAHKKEHNEPVFHFHKDFLEEGPTSEVALKFKAKFPESFTKFQEMVKFAYEKEKKSPGSFATTKERLTAVTNSITLAIKEFNMTNIAIWDESNCPPVKGLLGLMGD